MFGSTRSFGTSLLSRPSLSQALSTPQGGQYTGNGQQVHLRVHHDRFVAATKQRSIPCMPTVIALRVQPVQMAHDPRHVALRRLNEQMIVIAQQAKGHDSDSPHLMAVGQNIEKELAIGSICEHILIGQAAIHDMIVGAWICNAKGSRHGLTVSGQPM
ncbi:hypothetical protein MNV_2170003 [Candidatus Methanoperedens nitroreducens]|uniref:Uncharacterized protein n=1 Tax=Candidatus Methanoperedens nitratireducens TaxID=1392998 RepID=A0A284VP31_9EURY|nr:hypothetical protein MNV_2170003 [Candidatus Methanoperedens nitroreducens]